MADERKPIQQQPTQDKSTDDDNPVLDLQDDGETPEVEAHHCVSGLSQTIN